MNFYLATAILWLIIIPCVIAGCVGLWTLAALGWHAHKLNKLWDDTEADAWDRENLLKTGAGLQAMRRGLTDGPAPVPLVREWTIKRSRPYDHERGDAA